MKNPPHPGDFIRTEILRPAGLSVTAAAAALQVSRPALSSLPNGKADLSGDMALRIEKAFGVKLETLMRMQGSYDIAQTRKREKQIQVRRIHQVAPVHAQEPRGNCVNSFSSARHSPTSKVVGLAHLAVQIEIRHQTAGQFVAGYRGEPMTQLQKSQQELRAAWHAGQGLKKRPRKSGRHLFLTSPSAATISRSSRRCPVL